VPSTDDFRNELNRIFDAVEKVSSGITGITIRSKDLHDSLSDKNELPKCCNAMKDAMIDGDELIENPPSGLGANKVVLYKLPREKK
jgi:hypothetical protein